MREEIRKQIEALNLPQLLRGLETLSLLETEQFLSQLKTYTPDLLHQQRQLQKAPPQSLSGAKPWTTVHHSGSLEDKARGEELLSQGKAACLILAGGQGSRLNLGPKALIPVTPIQKKTLLQLFCEKARAASKRYGRPLPLCLMTSPLNHQVIESFLITHDFFGLDKNQVILFQQSLLPFLDTNGDFLLEKPGKIAEGPAGNGEALEKMHALHIFDQWEEVDYLNTILIDNPLADPFDAELIGLTDRLKCDATLKGVTRVSPEEKMGVFAEKEGNLRVVEYTELDASGPQFPYLNTGLFCFSVKWIQHLYGDLKVSLPWHLARKTLDGTLPIWKYETFLFDLFDHSKNLAALIYPREEIYAPLKNATGEKSLQTVREALLQCDRRILHSLTQQIPNVQEFELDPHFYYPTSDLKEKWQGKSLDKEGYVY